MERLGNYFKQKTRNKRGMRTFNQKRPRILQKNDGKKDYRPKAKQCLKGKHEVHICG